MTDVSATRAALHTYVALWTVTALTAAAAWPAASALREILALRVAPHNAATVADAAGIAAHNLRAAAVPLLCCLLRTAGWGSLRRLGDVVVATTLIANAALGGVALGTYGAALLPYLPHLPLEWAALAVAGSAWARTRTKQLAPAELVRAAATCSATLVLAAAVETFIAPHH